MSLLVNIFLEPAKAFRDLQEKPRFLLPLLLVLGSMAVFAMLYHLWVDPEWFARHQEAMVLAGNPEMTRQEIEQMRQFMPGARVMAAFSAIGVFLFLGVMYLVAALYYWLAGKVTGTGIGYLRGLSLAAWSGMPIVLGVLAGLVAMYTSSSHQAPFESLQLLNIDPLFVQLPLDHDWSQLAKSFSLLNLWTWFLVALGWRTWFKTGWGQAITVSLLPSVVIYGIWLIVVLV